MEPPKKELSEYLQELEQDLQNVKQLNERMHKISVLLEEFRFGDILRNYSNPRRVLTINFLAGLARGLGLTVGTAIILGMIGYILGQFISMPVIGEYISNLLDYVKQYQILKSQ